MLVAAPIVRSFIPHYHTATTRNHRSAHLLVVVVVVVVSLHTNDDAGSALTVESVDAAGSARNGWTTVARPVSQTSFQVKKTPAGQHTRARVGESSARERTLNNI